MLLIEIAVLLFNSTRNYLVMDPMCNKDNNVQIGITAAFSKP